MTATHSSLWHLTRGQRLRYGGAILAMATTNMFMFGAPLIGRYAIDVVVEDDFSFAAPPLLWLARSVGSGESYHVYLWLSALAAVLLTVLAGAALYVRGRLAALASESIVRGLREAMYRRLHHLHARYYDSADTGDLVQRASSDVETVRVFSPATSWRSGARSPSCSASARFCSGWTPGSARWRCASCRCSRSARTCSSHGSRPCSRLPTRPKAP